MSYISLQCCSSNLSTLSTVKMRLSITFALASLTCIASCDTIFVQLGVEGTTYRECFKLSSHTCTDANLAVSHGIRDPTYDGVRFSSSVSQKPVREGQR